MKAQGDATVFAIWNPEKHPKTFINCTSTPADSAGARGVPSHLGIKQPLNTPKIQLGIVVTTQVTVQVVLILQNQGLTLSGATAATARVPPAST
ncbi:MAG: hypothetical protein ACLGG1_09590, partial [Gammaproteobacteria bacterium]